MEWDVWRVVRAGYATLDEVYSRWSQVDLLEANIVITAIEHAEAQARKQGAPT